MLRQFFLSTVCLGFLVVSPSFAQDKHDTVKLAGFEVEGTHLPRKSVVRLLGLQVGQTANEEIMNAACDHLTKTGLIKDINYRYQPKSDGSGVVVSFKIFDEEPLLPASVFPQQNEPAMWACLQSADPIFQKQLPNTVDALRFYVANMNKCITQTSNQALHAVAQVLCGPDKKPAKVEFRIEPGPATENNAILPQIQQSANEQH